MLNMINDHDDSSPIYQKNQMLP